MKKLIFFCVFFFLKDALANRNITILLNKLKTDYGVSIDENFNQSIHEVLGDPSFSLGMPYLFEILKEKKFLNKLRKNIKRYSIHMDNYTNIEKTNVIQQEIDEIPIPENLMPVINSALNTFDKRIANSSPILTEIINYGDFRIACLKRLYAISNSRGYNHKERLYRGVPFFFPESSFLGITTLIHAYFMKIFPVGMSLETLKVDGRHYTVLDYALHDLAHGYVFESALKARSLKDELRKLFISSFYERDVNKIKNLHIFIFLTMHETPFCEVKHLTIEEHLKAIAVTKLSNTLVNHGMYSGLFKLVGKKLAKDFDHLTSAYDPFLKGSILKDTWTLILIQVLRNKELDFIHRFEAAKSLGEVSEHREEALIFLTKSLYNKSLSIRRKFYVFEAIKKLRDLTNYEQVSLENLIKYPENRTQFKAKEIKLIPRIIKHTVAKNKQKELGFYLLTHSYLFWGKQQEKIVKLLETQGLLDCKGHEKEILLSCDRKYWSQCFELIGKFSPPEAKKAYREIIHNETLGFSPNVMFAAMSKLGLNLYKEEFKQCIYNNNISFYDIKDDLSFLSEIERRELFTEIWKNLDRESDRRNKKYKINHTHSIMNLAKKLLTKGELYEEISHILIKPKDDDYILPDPILGYLQYSKEVIDFAKYFIDFKHNTSVYSFYLIVVDNIGEFNCKRFSSGVANLLRSDLCTYYKLELFSKMINHKFLAFEAYVWGVQEIAKANSELKFADVKKVLLALLRKK